MATVWKHPKSPFWTAVFRDEQNRWRKKSTKLKDRSKALALALEFERAATMGREATLTEAVSREVVGGILERTTGEKLRVQTVREFCAEWLSGKSHSKQEGTSTRYKGTVDWFLSFLGKRAELPITAVTPGDCQRFHDALCEEGLAPATRVVEMKTLSTVFNAARRLGLLSSNPVSPVELPQRVKQVRRRTFTPEQVAMLLGVAEGGWRTVILLGYYAGLRLSDAVTLSWESVDLAGGCLRFEQQKTGEELVIPLHSTLELHLSKLAGDTGGPVCPALAVVPVGGRSGLSRQFLALMREAGVGNDAVQTGGQRKLSRLSFHALRVTYNSTMHNAGVTQEVRKKLTGHKSDAVNDRYTRTELDTLRAAVNTLPSLKA